MPIGLATPMRYCFGEMTEPPMLGPVPYEDLPVGWSYQPDPTGICPYEAHGPRGIRVWQSMDPGTLDQFFLGTPPRHVPWGDRYFSSQKAAIEAAEQMIAECNREEKANTPVREPWAPRIDGLARVRRSDEIVIIKAIERLGPRLLLFAATDRDGRFVGLFGADELDEAPPMPPTADEMLDWLGSRYSLRVTRTITGRFDISANGGQVVGAGKTLSDAIREAMQNSSQISKKAEISV